MHRDLWGKVIWLTCLKKIASFAKTFRGLYTEKTNMRKTMGSEKFATGGTFLIFYMLWYTLNAITRILSFVGLFYVFYEVFVAFRPSQTFHIAYLPCMPYVILLLVGRKFHSIISRSTPVYFTILRKSITPYKFQVTYSFSITT